jgi:ribose 5-phosphate isomerase
MAIVALAKRAGIVESGLFLGMATRAVICDESGAIQTLE